MNAAAISRSLVDARIPEQWATVAAMRVSDVPPDELAAITSHVDAFVQHVSHRLEALKDRLIAAGFRFLLPAHCLRRAGAEDIQALVKFVEAHGPLPVSVEIWYRRIAAFNFCQDGAQMFDRSHGLVFMQRFQEFTMPPVATACSSRWSELMGWEGDDEDCASDDRRLVFLMEEFGMNEDWMAFELPDDSIDPVIAPETGLTFLQWADQQSKWGGFGGLARAMRHGAAGDVSAEVVTRVFGERWS